MIVFVSHSPFLSLLCLFCSNVISSLFHFCYYYLQLKIKTESEYNLRDIQRWAASDNIFTMDVGDLSDGFIILLTSEGDDMADLISGYLKRRTGFFYFLLL